MSRRETEGFDFDTRLLRCIVTIVEEKSLSRAAEKLYLSQPALSRALRRFRYFPQGGPFALIADARPIDELNRSGARSLLLERILSALEASL